MRKFSFITLLLLATSLLFAQSPAQPAPRSGGSTPAADTVNAQPQSPLIRILTPVADQASSNNSVQLKYELTNPGAAAGEPNYIVQLDGQDPITTTSTEHTFTGLTPGAHSVTVTLVDANKTPINGGRAVVQFKVKNPPSTTGGLAESVAPPVQQPSQLQIDKAEFSAAAPQSLSILSIVGFGVLLGGAVSSFRTRRR